MFKQDDLKKKYELDIFAQLIEDSIINFARQ